MVSDSLEEAKKFAESTWGKSKEAEKKVSGCWRRAGPRKQHLTQSVP
jgi:hypothetical protein